MQKSNKTIAILLFILVLIIVLAIFAYLHFAGAPAASQSQTSSQSFPSNYPSGSTNGVTSNTSGSNSSNNTAPTGTQTSTSTTTSTAAPLPQLRQISQTPTAGAISFDQGTTTIIRYVERSTGHVFQTTESSSTVTRLTDTRIPEVYQAVWLKNGSGVYVRYQDSASQNIDTYYATLQALPQSSAQENTAVSTSTSSTAVQYAPDQLLGQFLPTNITSLTLSPSGNSLFYLEALAGGSSEGVTAKTDGSGKTDVFDSPLSEWLTQWVTANTIAFTTKASAGENGYLYFLTTADGAFVKIMGDIAGLTTLTSPDTSQVLFSYSQNNSGITTGLYTIKSNTFAQLPVNTLPEKCVWSQKDTSLIYCAVPEQIPAGNYPDDWYQGNVFFTDDLISINLQTGTTTTLAKPTVLVGQQIDATNLMLSAKENYLLFLNKRDGTLWSLNLAQSI